MVLVAAVVGRGAAFLLQRRGSKFSMSCKRQVNASRRQPQHVASSRAAAAAAEIAFDCFDALIRFASFPATAFHVSTHTLLPLLLPTKPRGSGAGSDKGALAIVLAGGYADDSDEGEAFWYTGEGGQEKGKQVILMSMSAPAMARMVCYLSSVQW